MSLRFCMLTTFYPPYNFGGDGVFVRALAEALVERGHHVEVIHCADSYRLLAGREPIDSLEQSGVRVHRLESPYGMLSPLATHQTGQPYFKTRKIQQILSDGFDVIHFHNASLIGGPGLFRYGKALKLYTIHEYWLVCPTHLLYRYNRELCDERDCIRCSLSFRRPPQLWRYTGLLESMLPRIDRFISPSRFAIELHQRMGLELKVTHIPNFVADLPPLPETTQQSSYFLYVGRLEWAKGLQTLLPVFRNYRRARLLVAGRGSCEAEMRQLAAGSPNIDFLGHTSGEKLRDLVRGAVAVIVPSICYEIFSLVILEAFREATPVIARRIGGMPELIDRTKGGLLYESEGGLLAAMEQMLDDRDYRNRIGIAARTGYLKGYTTEAHMTKYLELVRELRT